MDQGVDLAFREHGLDGFIIRDALKAQARRGREVDGFGQFRIPVDGLEGHAIFMVKQPAQPKDRG